MYDCTVPLNFMLLSSAFTSFYLPQQYLHLFLSASTIYLRFTRRLANKLPRWTRPCLKRSTTTNPLYHPQQYPQNYPQFILVYFSVRLTCQSHRASPQSVDSLQPRWRTPSTHIRPGKTWQIYLCKNIRRLGVEIVGHHRLIWKGSPTHLL